jgi:hypothetical protein
MGVMRRLMRSKRNPPSVGSWRGSNESECRDQHRPALHIALKVTCGSQVDLYWAICRRVRFPFAPQAMGALW